MTEVVLVIHLLIAMALIGVVLLQRSEGGALGIGGGGGGGGGSLFSSRGVGNALTRATAFLAVGFFCTSITLTIMARTASQPTSVFDDAQTQQNKGVDTKLPSLPGPTTPTTPQVPE